MSRLVLLLLALTCSTSWAEDRSGGFQPPNETRATKTAAGSHRYQLAFFETKIRPVLVEQCLACHSNDDKQKGDSH